jgi:hypothetical protein
MILARVRPPAFFTGGASPMTASDPPTTEFPKLMWLKDGHEITVSSQAEQEEKEAEGATPIPPGYQGPLPWPRDREQQAETQPTAAAPARHQEYPRLLFRCATDPAGRIKCEERSVRSPDEEHEAQAAGWVRHQAEAEAVEKARQEAVAAARQEQEARKLAEVFSRVLDEREEKRKKPAGDEALRKAEREGIVLPVFELLGDEWNPTRWALNAGVGPECPLRYLSGHTKRLHSVNRDRLTKALNDALKAKRLPLVVLPP